MVEVNMQPNSKSSVGATLLTNFKNQNTTLFNSYYLYEYFGLVFLFYSQEHEPIHVHGKFQDTESKAEIIFKNGKFKEIVIKEVQGKKPLEIQNLKKFKKIVELYRDDIIRKWIDFFVYNIEFPSEKITKKI